ncbi:DDE family transposase [Arcicella aurantiaca]|uniref:DDE family transposase n=1 Tax=Arcicella aurantiaca TaxID=591202 RepID=A0A316EFN2_9BACT|nr:IS4 family transposase [Arcicella aurantiaca]PWK28911.1 DDE family transposase [Arcicella aurantiaca]
MEKNCFKDINLSSTCFGELSKFFKAESIERLGREVKFVERSTSRLSAWMFLQLNTCLVSNGKVDSLNDLGTELFNNFGVKLTKQSLDERFNIHGVSFMRKCFESIFEKVLSASSKQKHFSCGFKRIILRDATSFQLPSDLTTYYQGNAGDTTGSVIKIQHEFDLLSGKILKLDFRNGKETDTDWLNQKGIDISANDLHLMDLGYYKLTHFTDIAQKGGYFISRYKIGTSLFTKNLEGEYQPIEWDVIFEQIKGDNFEKELYLGCSKNKLKVRLHLQKIPEAIVQKRLKKYENKEKNQSKKRRSPYRNSDFKKELAHYNVFITNAPQQLLKTSQIYPFYMLRWQIELLFKIWKSVFEIDKIGKMSIARFECYLYGKLISILLSGYIQRLFNDFTKQQTDFELSEWKAYKIVKKT